MVFGVHDRANPASADLLGEPWWAGHAPGSGTLDEREGGRPGPLPEVFLAGLSDDPARISPRPAGRGRNGLWYVFKAVRPFRRSRDGSRRRRDRSSTAGDRRHGPSARDGPGRTALRAWPRRPVGRRFRIRAHRHARRRERDPGRPIAGAGLQRVRRAGKNGVSLCAWRTSRLSRRLSRAPATGSRWTSRGPASGTFAGGFDRYEVLRGQRRAVSLAAPRAFASTRP